MKKILLTIIVFLLLINITYSATNIINAKLDKSTYGPQKAVIGNLSINISGLPSSTKLILELDGQSQELNPDPSSLCSIKDASYSLVGKGTGTPSIVFDSAGTNINYGVDINTQSPLEKPTLTINSFAFEINGSKSRIFLLLQALIFLQITS